MNNTRNSSAIFTLSGCLTEEALMMFVSGTLAGKELLQASKHLASCELCTDAADGLRLWFKQNKDEKTEVETNDVKTETSKSATNAGKPFILPTYRFHIRTDAINDRLKQRIEFHKKIEAVEQKKISFNLYVWISVAASIVLFIGIFYAVKVQTLLDKKQLANANKEMQAIPQKADSNITSESMSEIALSQKSIKQQKPRKSPALCVADVYDDMVLNQEEVILENQQPESSIPLGALSEEAKPFESKTASSVMSEAEVVEKSPSPSIIDDTLTDDSILAYTIVEEMPQFPGGDVKRLKFLSENIIYPALASENGIQGTVYVGFIVKKDGQITDAKILRGIGGGCDEEALRVIKQMPNWEPGKQNGKKVDVLFNMPVLFKLRN